MSDKVKTYLDVANIYKPEGLRRNKKDGSKLREADPESLDVIRGNPDDVITMSHVDIGFKLGTDLRVVVEDFNLSLKRGEIFGLVGESGSGKTTVGRSIMRIIPILKGGGALSRTLPEVLSAGSLPAEHIIPCFPTTFPRK